MDQKRSESAGLVVKNKKDKCIECESYRKKLMRVVTPFGTIPVCKGCFDKVFEVKVGK